MACYVFASEKVVSSLGKHTASLETVDEDHIANSPEGQSFREAVRGGDMITAVKIFNDSNYALIDYCVEHLIILRRSELVVELINNTRKGIELEALRTFVVHANRPFIDEVLDKTNIPDRLLSGVAYNADLVCMPEKLTYFLGKITDEKDQEEAVENGVKALFVGDKTYCFDPLLFALEGKTFLSLKLGKIAIRTAFWAAIYYDKDSNVWVKSLFDHVHLLLSSVQR